MNAAVVIPARLGSVRVPRKPLQLISGRELILHVCDAVSQARLIDRVIVATDSEEIKECVLGAGFEARLTSSDHQTGTDRVAEVAKDLTERVIINVQGDEPFLPPDAVDLVAALLLEDKNVQLHTLAVPFLNDDPSDPNTVKIAVDRNGNALYFSRSLIPHAWREGGIAPWMHVGIYGFQKEALFRFVSFERSPLEKSEGLEQLRALENGMPIRVSLYPAPFRGVETIDDLRAARDHAGKSEEPLMGKGQGT